MSGEGLYSFFKRNNLESDFAQDLFFELNDGKFGRNNGLLAHQTYKVPILNGKDIYMPLYGKEREQFSIETSLLKGAVFYLVSGHGGPDPGAIGKYGSHTLSEDEYAYDVTLRLAKRLQENGAKVYLIIQDADDGIRDEAFLKSDKDEKCGGNNIYKDQNRRLAQRTREVNRLYKQDKAKYKRCIVLHVDSRSKQNRIDVFFYHFKRSGKGKKMANTLSATLKSKYREHQPKRGFSGTVSARNLYLLRETRPVTVFVELGNIQNYRDQQRFIKADNRQALANWLCEGIIQDYEAIHR